MQRLRLEVTKFAAVGALNFALTLVVFAMMLRFFLADYRISLFVAWLVGMVFTYSLNFAWVFKPEDKIQFRDRFAKYIFASSLSIAVNLAILNQIVENSEFDPFYVQIALIPLIVVINFTTAKFWSLRQSND